MEPTGVALVTGASRGLGRAVALALAGAGFDVVATMRRPADGADLPAAAAGLAGSLRVERLDLTDPATMVVPDGLRVLVNNAGTEADYLPVEATPPEQWREVFETNVFGTVELTRRAVGVLRAGGGGVICNVTSSSLVVAVPFYAVYRASKAALQAMGESLRAEVAPLGIRVVEVLPGPVATDMLARSERVPEAASVDGYADGALALHRARLGVGEFTVSAESAAAEVVAAVLDDAGPLRRSCDGLGAQLLAAWRADPEGTLGVG